MSLNSLSVKKLVVAYLFCIFLYAVIYFFSPSGFLNKELSFINALYFSIVTITTLGYGDILPKSEIIQLVISSQALLGLVIFGLLINSVWSSYLDKVELQSEQRMRHQIELESDRKLKAYSNAISWTFNNMMHSFFEITTPVEEREGKSQEFNPDFRGKDLVGIFDISLKYNNGLKTSIEAFYKNEESLIGELKFILANFDLDHHPELQESITKYLGFYFSDQSKDRLLLDCKNSMYSKSVKAIKNLLNNYDDEYITDRNPIDPRLMPVMIFSLTVTTKFNLVVEIDNLLRNIGGEVT